ncbi:macoilin-2-like [Anopheles bellator]|uniref:macoilin-2-like n=1 Tax=Anopheles bellator TaxID=139047 RepID=UPI0026476144|nr:macoilin-2-like [Anopheles bellator]
MDPVLLERERVLFRLNEEINAKSRGLFELNENVSWMTTKRRLRHGMKKLNNGVAAVAVEESPSSTETVTERETERATTDDEPEQEGTGDDRRSAIGFFATVVSESEQERSLAGEQPATTTTLTEIRCDAIQEEQHLRSGTNNLQLQQQQQLQLVKVTTVSVEQRKVTAGGGQRVTGGGGGGGGPPGNGTLVASKSVTSSARNLSKNMADVVPKVLEKKNISTEGLIKFLKSKAAILQTEMESSQKQNEANVKDLHLALDSLKQLEALKEQLLTKNGALERTVKKFEERNLELDKLLKEKDVQLNHAAKELYAARSEIRNLAQINQTQEKRLYKAHEEAENLRIKLNIANDSEKETRDGARQERITYEKQIKQLRKQRTEVLADYKKLLLSVDQLKKQNFNQEQSKLINDFEKDYFRHLEDPSLGIPSPTTI